MQKAINNNINTLSIMAKTISTGSTGVNQGASLRIGYRVAFSTGAFTYVNPYPTSDQLPYQFTVPGSGQWEIEYTQLCPSCSGDSYSNPVTVRVTVP